MKDNSITISAIILLVCLFWMDACLYFQIQCISEKDQMSNLEANITSPSETQTPIGLMNKFSFAFRGMSVKLMMTDPVDNYLFGPLSEAFADMVNFKDNFLFITPNMISFAGLVSALIAGKLVSQESATLHKLSFVMFQLRTWLDDLDGVVARSRMGIHKHVSLQKTNGYVVDGVCDAIGFVAYIIGCYVYLMRTIRRRTRPANRYNLRSITEIKSAHSSSSYIPLQDHNEDDEERLSHAKKCSEYNVFVGRDAEDDDDDDEDDESNGEGDVMHHMHLSHVHTEQSRDDVKCDDTRQLMQSGDKNSFPRSRMYENITRDGKQSSVIFYRYIREKLRDNLSNRGLLLVTICFLLQLLMCAIFWNRYILVYRDLLESPSSEPSQSHMKAKILKSNITYVIIWFWRMTNGHSFMQMLIAAVFIGKLWQFLDFIKYIGFIEIILLATITELHLIDARNFIGSN